MYEIRKIRSDEVTEALALALEVFMQFEAPDYKPEGVETFRNVVENEEFIAKCRQGIATSVFRYMLDDILKDNPELREIRLNSSPYGKPFYLHLGFEPLSEEQEMDGIRFTPMKYTIPATAVTKLLPRTRENAVRYFQRTQDAEFRQTLPSSARTLEEALEAYTDACQPDATSYGKSIYYRGNHVGDIWCYGIKVEDTPNAMLSYCIFEKSLWGQGIASIAVPLFLEEIAARYGI